MKKSIIIISLIFILLVSPLAQAQTQTYSGFDRFVDNVKMLFSSGDNKLLLVSEVREKEISSAIENTNKGDNDEANKNLKRARENLQFMQKEVSLKTAEEIKTSVDVVINKINQEENLPDNFKVYVLEEEKTQLTAELVIVVEGEEGQTETRIVEEKLGEINTEIKEWTVEIFEKTIDDNDNYIDDGLVWEIKTDIDSGDYGGDDGLTPQIKNYIAGDGTQDIKGDFIDKSNKGGIIAPGTIVDDAPGSDDASPDDLIDDVTGEPITHNIDSPANDIPDPIPGDLGPPIEDNSNDEVTGESIKNIKTESFLKKVFNFLFSKI